MNRIGIPLFVSARAGQKCYRAIEKTVRELLSKKTTIFQYTHGTKDVSRINSDSYTKEKHFMDRLGNDTSLLKALDKQPGELI
jgi:hypothetical protein